jgi:hypothetical protein
LRSVIEILDSDKEQDYYLGLTYDEQNEFTDEILLFANNNRIELIKYCQTIEPTQFCNLEIIYEALAKDPDNWGEFIFTEYKRIFSEAKNSNNPFIYTSCLDIGLYFEEKNYPFVDKIINLLSLELESQSDALRHRALWFLSDWIEDEYSSKYTKVIDKMAKLINDKNWKIRYSTFFLFKGRTFAENYQINLSLKDRITEKLSVFFSNPFEITE